MAVRRLRRALGTMAVLGLMAVAAPATLAVAGLSSEEAPRTSAGPREPSSGAVLGASSAGTRSAASCGLPAELPPVGEWPSGCWRPYAASSPFNRPIGRAPRLQPGSREIVRRVTGFGPLEHLTAGTADTREDWGHPTYYARPESPQYTIRCLERWGRCPVEGKTVRVPGEARPAGGSDGHMTVIDAAAGVEYDFWRVRSKPPGGGELKISWGGRIPLAGRGTGADATAARFGNLAGIIRAQELERGRIDHALFMVAECDSGRHVYPALKNGRACSVRGRSNRGAPAMGARFQLAMSAAEIEALSAPRWRKAILHAMAEYGMYMGDVGTGGWGIQAESGSTYTSFGRKDALVAFGEANGVPQWKGRRVFRLRDGIDWRRRLRVVHPCEARGSC